jgi:hypothetical protein
MDKGVLAAFEANDSRQALRFVIKESDNNTELSVIQIEKIHNK